MIDAKATKKAAAPKKPAEHPKYSEMIISAITTLKERNGSSRQAIVKYIKANYKVKDNCETHIKLALKRGVLSAALAQPKGTGASGSFKVIPVPKKKPAAKKPAAKKTQVVAKKPAAKKTTPKKKAAPKRKNSAKKAGNKSTPKKKAAKAKRPVSAKKSATKKPASKRPAKKAAKKTPKKKAAAKK